MSIRFKLLWITFKTFGPKIVMFIKLKIKLLLSQWIPKNYKHFSCIRFRTFCMFWIFFRKPATFEGRGCLQLIIVKQTIHLSFYYRFVQHKPENLHILLLSDSQSEILSIDICSLGCSPVPKPLGAIYSDIRGVSGSF